MQHKRERDSLDFMMKTRGLMIPYQIKQSDNSNELPEILSSQTRYLHFRIVALILCKEQIVFERELGRLESRAVLHAR